MSTLKWDNTTFIDKFEEGLKSKRVYQKKKKRVSAGGVTYFSNASGSDSSCALGSGFSNAFRSYKSDT
jgi:hypothetical protein